jgi:hypothetical protein
MFDRKRVVEDSRELIADVAEAERHFGADFDDLVMDQPIDGVPLSR